MDKRYSQLLETIAAYLFFFQNNLIFVHSFQLLYSFYLYKIYTYYEQNRKIYQYQWKAFLVLLGQQQNYCFKDGKFQLNIQKGQYQQLNDAISKNKSIYEEFLLFNPIQQFKIKPVSIFIDETMSFHDLSNSNIIQVITVSQFTLKRTKFFDMTKSSITYKLTNREYIYLICRMKHAHSANPSRSEVLAWINSQVENTIGPVKRIEDLGNGAPYLFLLAALRPGAVRIEKIIKHPINHHESLQNLKLLVTIFEKLRFNFRIEMEKIVQMKYQQNFYLSCFLYKTLALNHDESSSTPPDTKENSNQVNRLQRVKVLPPEKIVPVVLKKENALNVSDGELGEMQTNSQRKLKEIEVTMKESRPNQEKLEKIAAILNLTSAKQDQQSIATMTQEGVNNPLSIQASYKRFLRPSLCQKSSFLNKKQPLSFEKNESGMKMEVVSARNNLTSNMPFQEIIQPTNEFEGEMLLSQKKQPENEKQEDCQPMTNPFTEEAPAQTEKVEEATSENPYPTI